MNFNAQVTNIQQNDALACLCCKSDFGELKFFTLQLPKEVEIGVNVILGFKSFDLLISKQPCKLFCSNELITKITKITNQGFFTHISLQCKNHILETIIDNKNSDNLNLLDDVYVYLSYYSIYIDEILC